ncbi:MAG: hypothetical protein JOZ10_13950 [Acidobacteria bacterium]|nr:hypothetical protein [Acidobacteriota bacterium]MBV9145846.1 hypothetical protein [Acidobacteriota bacterium]
MKILFDQNTPVPIRDYLTGHIVRTASEQGWSTLLNGDLLRVAEEAGFELLITADKNIAYQQSFRERKIALLVLGSGQWPAIRNCLEKIAAAIQACRPGTVTFLEIP